MRRAPCTELPVRPPTRPLQGGLLLSTECWSIQAPVLWGGGSEKTFCTGHTRRKGLSWGPASGTCLSQGSLWEGSRRVRKGLSRHQGQGSQTGFSQGALLSQEIDVKTPIHETEESGAGGRVAGPDARARPAGHPSPLLVALGSAR